jgi:hypothetical protein
MTTVPTAAFGSASETTDPRVRPRAVVIGFVLSAAICALTPFNNAYLGATPLGGGHFPLAPFFILFCLTLAVAGIGRLAPGVRLLTGRELLVVWALMLLASGIAYTGLARTFFINLTAPYHFATTENRWQEVIHPLLPSSWYPQNHEAVEALYNGVAGGRQMGWLQVLRAIPWQAWTLPLAVWSLFVLMCYAVMVCVVNLLGRQPLENERMNFPLLRLPQMMEEALDAGRLGRFLGNRFLLTGMLIPMGLHLLNGLNFYFPQVPQIPTLMLVGHYFPGHGLFAGFVKLKIFIYPAFIGFAFLAAKQISFSFWFFFLAGSLLIGVMGMLGYAIPPAALGVTFGPTLSRPEETQMIGAYAVFFIFLAWLARHHLVALVRQALGMRTDVPAETHWLPLPLAFWGFLLGSVGIVVWLVSFGMPLGAAVLLIGAFFMVTLVATRVICQGGLGYFTLTAAPTDGLLAFFGPHFFTPIGLVIAAVTQKVLFLDLRESLMPSLMHTRKLTQGIKGRTVVMAGIVLTLVAAVVISFTAMLALYYRFGVRELQMDWAIRTSIAVYENLYTLVDTPLQPGRWVLIFTAIGAAVMLVLVVCYHRFYWWPIHPIGYLTAYSSAMWTLWFSFFVGWLCNALCMRYGGVILFRRLRLFFMGLIIGDFLMGGAWAIVGLFTGSSYVVLPD